MSVLMLTLRMTRMVRGLRWPLSLSLQCGLRISTECMAGDNDMCACVHAETDCDQAGKLNWPLSIMSSAALSHVNQFDNSLQIINRAYGCYTLT